VDAASCSAVMADQKSVLHDSLVADARPESLIVNFHVP
jgi:hypothetical protein